MRMSVILHICINIFFGKHLGIQNLIFSCSLSLQILHNIPDGFVTDLITGLRAKRHDTPILNRFQGIFLSIYGNNRNLPS